MKAVWAGNFPELETPNLRLRQILPKDAASLLACLCDGEATRYLGSEPLATLEDAEQLIRNFEAARHWSSPGIRFGLCLHTTPDQLIGSCGIFGYQSHWQCAQLAFDVAPAFRRRGFGKQATQAVITWAFATLRLERLNAQVHPDNIPSLRLLAALGFVREGIQRQVGYWGGRHHDMLQLGLLWRDWKLRFAPS